MNAPVRTPLNAVPLPTVDFLRADPLADESLFAEPEISRRAFDARGYPRTWRVGTGAPNWIDICRHIVGDADLGILASPTDPNGGYVIMRRRDWEVIERERAAA